MKKLFYLSIVFCTLFYADYSNSAPIYYGGGSDLSLGQIITRDTINNVTWAFLTKKRDNLPSNSNNVIIIPAHSSVHYPIYTCHYCPNRKDLQCELTKNLECCECLQEYVKK